jgi:uncharacterized membrane protein YqaE (UPF0057 family)
MDTKLQLLIQLFDGKTIVKIFDKNIKIFEIKNQINKSLNCKHGYLVFNGKLLNDNSTLDDNNIKNNEILFYNKKLKGGIFDTIIMALVAFMELMINLMKMLVDLIPIFVKVIDVIPTIFNPKRFINDLIFAISFSLRSLIDGITSSISSGSTPKKNINNKSSLPSVCIPPTFANLLFLVICPPLALFLDRGMSGIFHVVICSILTMKLYYFPGLIYAALHILC